MKKAVSPSSTRSSFRGRIRARRGSDATSMRSISARSGVSSTGAAADAIDSAILAYRIVGRGISG